VLPLGDVKTSLTAPDTYSVVSVEAERA
jgi:hypothetical protein